METFCTIITYSYMPYAIALYKSIAKFNENIHFNVFIADLESADSVRRMNNVYFFGCADVCTDELGHRIKTKYRNGNMSVFRWSMKPVFLNFLLSERNYRKAIFVDPDMYFFGDYDFLFKELDTYDVLLTPHWRGINPHADPKSFILDLTQGLYNAGCIGVTPNGREAMKWWAMVCEYACEVNLKKGLYDDQKYLNLIPVYFENVGIVSHKGCNVAFWNRLFCKRHLQNDGTVLIDGKYPVVFIHFTHGTVEGILDGRDSHLLEYLSSYAEALKTIDPDLDIIATASNRIKQRKRARTSLLARVKKKLKNIAGLCNTIFC